jgi:Zn-finger nucleic acid-binding protein
MANCINCGAALTGTLLVCEYCKTRQDVDLSVVHRFTVEAPCSPRICPRCHIPLQTVDLRLQDKFLIERCTRCLGLFFDPGELEALLEKAVANVHAVDPQRLDEVQGVKRRAEYPVTYIDCPICRKLMNRVNFGARSGVIADWCRGHGMWLDGGELRQILEWTKAGGGLASKQAELEKAKLELEEEKRKLQFRQIDAAFSHSRPEPETRDFEIDLLPMIGRLLKKIFH